MLRSHEKITGFVTRLNYFSYSPLSIKIIPMKKPLYNSLKEWRKAEPIAYQAAINKDAIKMICEKFGWEHIKKNKQSNYWTLEKCTELSLKCNSRSEFSEKYGSAYKIAKINNWLEECCAHMIIIRRPVGYWTLERCKKVALKCSSRTEFHKKHGDAHSAAIRNSWIDECYAHMIEFKKPIGYWTLERCKELALKFNSKIEFKRENNSSYASALRNNWLNECCAHMISLFKPKGYWTLEKCKDGALNCNSRVEFKKKYQGAFGAAKRNNWLDECCAHMKK